MESATAEALTDTLKGAGCLISVPGRMSIDHMRPVGSGTTLRATAQFKRSDSADNNTLEFEVLVHIHESNTIIGKGTFWRTITCKENLESTAYLTGIERSPTETESAFRTYIQRKTTSMPCSSSQDSTPHTNACELCYPFPKRSWSGVAHPAHDPISRGFLHAVHHGSPRLVESWITSGIDIPRAVLDSALYTAVCARRADILERLIQRAGADPVAWKSADIEAQSIIFVALDVRPGSRIQDDHTNPLLAAAGVDGSTAGVIRVLLCAGVDPNICELETYWSALHLAVWNRDGESVSVLLEFGADLNMTEDEGWTPLHVAVQCGDVEAVAILLAGGADGESRTGKGDTPVMLGVRLRQEMVVKNLLLRGCKAGLGRGRVSAWDWLGGAPVPDLEGHGNGRALRP